MSDGNQARYGINLVKVALSFLGISIQGQIFCKKKKPYIPRSVVEQD